jgi:hypothetical protein
MLYGSAESEPQTDIVVAQVAQEFYNNNLLYSLICNLSKIDFEVRHSLICLVWIRFCAVNISSNLV